MDLSSFNDEEAVKDMINPSNQYDAEGNQEAINDGSQYLNDDGSEGQEIVEAGNVGDALTDEVYQSWPTYYIYMVVNLCIRQSQY